MNFPKKTLVELIYIFIICSYIGWFIEISNMYIVFDKIVKRGILYTPLCSIYGFGAIILYFLSKKLPKLKNNFFILFISCAITLGLFELLSGLFFKFTLNIEMWNYDNQFLEIFNYTTIPILLIWGILGTSYIYFFQPSLLKYINNLKNKYAIAIIIITLYFIDLTFSVINILKNPNVLDVLTNI